MLVRIFNLWNLEEESIKETWPVSPPPPVLPTLTGTCDQEHFFVSVKYGSQGHHFKTMVGHQDLTPELGETLAYQDNGTHFSIVVPYAAPVTAFEVT